MVNISGSPFDDNNTFNGVPFIFRAQLDGTNLDDVIFADAGNDLVFANDGNDLVFSGTGNDTVDGGNGNDIVFGEAGRDSLDGGLGNDSLDGGAGNDILNGNDGDDSFIGSVGSDNINGGIGNDRVDYSNLTGAITLQATGIVNKGSAGTDNLVSVETIVAKAGQANLIDASTATGTTSIVVNLSSNALAVNNIPGLGNLRFTVQNFRNVIGTSQSDNIVGDSQNNQLTGGAGNDFIDGSSGNDNLKGGNGRDTLNGSVGNDTLNGESGNDSLSGGDNNDRFIGSTGNDTVNGGNGIDRVDYNSLSGAITLQATGIVNKGTAGTDNLIDVETIIAKVGKANLIDAASATGTTSIVADLTNNSLQVNNIPGLGTLNFTVQNFRNVTGTSQSDSITGNTENNLLNGGAGDDFLDGLGGNDTIDGGSGNDFILGFVGADSLNGGDGDDFVLAENNNDTLIGSAGNDTLDGSLGADTVNYSNLSGPITLQTTGIVNKGAAGTDSLVGVETIIAKAGQANVIDASGANNTASIFADLSINLLEVNISGLAILDFTVQNFLNITGTALGDGITGNNQNNLFNGGFGDDFLNGLSGNDTLNGNDGSDFILGSLGNDSVNGGNGNDFLLGEDNNDTLIGSAGDDRLTGGLGNDTLTGGTGADRFTFDSLSEGIDFITDFKASENDKIEINAFGFGASSTAQFSYDNPTGGLFFEGIKFANLQPNLGGNFLPSLDIELV